jgi:hypothetical protein
MTIGDAIASFLAKKDMTTDQLPLLSLHECKNGCSAGIKSWGDIQYKWKDVTSKSRRIVTFAMQVPLICLSLGTSTHTLAGLVRL